MDLVPQVRTRPEGREDRGLGFCWKWPLGACPSPGLRGSVLRGPVCRTELERGAGQAGSPLLTFIFYFRQVAGSPLVWLRVPQPPCPFPFPCPIRLLGRGAIIFTQEDLFQASSFGKKINFPSHTVIDNF